MLAIPFPMIDPVLVEVGPVSIRWYALSYIVGIFLGWWLVGRLNRRRKEPLLSPKAFDDLVMWVVIGIMLGGRLGYVLFYNSGYYFSHPHEMLAVWKGGMSFHGGLIGVIVTMLWFCRRKKIHYLALMDMLACAAPIGLCLGRIANFINGELYGRMASENVAWAVVFPGDAFARHPSQLYEAALEGLVLFVVVNLLAFRTMLLEKAGGVSGVFLLGYALARSFVEFYREPDPQLGFLFAGVTMGQVLCVPMAVVGIMLLKNALKITK
jgi:phosphatidylglycerol---prolipoprotein diacylglyceryl transferase